MTSLPWNTSESHIITLALKRRLTDRSTVHKQYIRPAYVNSALLKLKTINHLYADVAVSQRWENISSQSDPELWSLLTDQEDSGRVNLNPLQESDCLTDSEDEVEIKIPPQIQRDLQNTRSLNTTTCLHPTDGPSVTTEHVMNIAPGEGKIPVSFTSEPEWEPMAFPKLFPYGKNHYNEKRRIKLSPLKYINARLKCVDDRFATSTEYIFQALHWSESVSLQSSINITRQKRHQSDLTAGQLKDPNHIQRLVTNDELFATFKSIRGTPQYWKQMQLDMLAKIKQLGPYTFFVTGSAAEFQWTEIIQIVAKQYGQILTDEVVESMTWQDKRSWLERNPVTTARHIDYMFEQLWGKVILSGVHPIGQILNYDIRKEMQGRGTQHFHAAVHVKDAPQIDRESDEEVLTFIDKYVSCALPSVDSDPELHTLVTKRQVHHHTRTCKKKNRCNM